MSDSDAAELLREAVFADEPGELLREAREELGWPQWKLGERLGLHIHEFDDGRKQCRTLTGWESGEHSPGWKNRKKFRELADEIEEESDEEAS